MKYKKVEVKLKTNKSRDYLWNKINSPKKLVKIEGFNTDYSPKKVCDYTYEVKYGKDVVLLTFIPKKAIHLIFVGKRNYPLTWFEIRGASNCTIVHGEHKRIDSGMSKNNLKKEIEWVKEHFLEELKVIAE